MLIQIHKKFSYLKNRLVNFIYRDINLINLKHSCTLTPKSKYNFTTGNKHRAYKYEYNFQTIFDILKACNLEPNYHNENSLRTKYCPVCEKPHNEEPTNLNTFVIHKTNSTFFCYRCGNRGHFQRLLKILNKKHDLGEYKDLINKTGYSSNGNTTGTENEDFYPRKTQLYDDTLNEKRYDEYQNKDKNSNDQFFASHSNSNLDPQLNVNTINSLNSLNINNKETYKIFLNNTGLLNELYKRNVLLENEKCGIIQDYLLNDRKLKLETLKFYNVGVSYEKFKSNSYEYINLPCVTYPMFYSTDKSSYLSVDNKSVDEAIYNHYRCDKFYLSRLKVRAIGKEFKHFQRIEPSGSVLWGLFGLDTVPDDAEEIIITEGEYDAMAAYQELKIPSVSLPNGASSLPLQLLPYFGRFKKIYLWMDADQAGQIASENFSKKLGEGKTLIINTRRNDPNGPKDANDALKLGRDFKEFIRNAKPLSGDNIIKVSDIRGEILQFLSQYDRYSGYKSTSFPFFNQKLKGLRMGEFSILTGETGSGKTTFLTQLSLDFVKQGIPTLWGSFEIKNDKLASLFLMQYAKKNLRQSPVEEIEFQTENFEKLPLYMLKFHGSQNIDDVINTMNFAVFNHDIQNIVLDNLQFMVGIPSKISNKFDFQDEIIQRLRKFATEKNVHVTLVIHPRKDEVLRISSIFGTGKASQEADNIYILQSYKGLRIIDIAKNRFDGTVGKVAVGFDNNSCRFFELTLEEFSKIIKENFKLEDVIKERISKNGSVEPEIESHNSSNKKFIDEFNNSKKIEENLIYENAINQKEKELTQVDPKFLRKEKTLSMELESIITNKKDQKIVETNNSNVNKNYLTQTQKFSENFDEILLTEDDVEIKHYFKNTEELKNEKFTLKIENPTEEAKKLEKEEDMVEPKTLEDIKNNVTMTSLKSDLNITINDEKVDENLHTENKTEIFKFINDFQKNIFPQVKVIDSFHTKDSMEKTQSNNQKQNFGNFKNKFSNQRNGNFSQRGQNNYNGNNRLFNRNQNGKRDEKVRQSTYKINDKNSFMNDVF